VSAGTFINTLPPRTEIADRLWQGVGILPRDGYHGYDLVVNCEQHVRKSLLDGYTGVFLHVPMLDDEDWPIPEREVGIAAAAVRAMLQQGGSVYVHCTAGLNRSGLVVAAVLLGSGYTAREVIAHMRCARHAHVLSNRSFAEAVERWASA
jgi:hypothetical protein